MARMTISIDDSLRKRMDRLKTEINWSAIAAAAFEQQATNEEQKMQQLNLSKNVGKLRQRLSRPATKVELKGVAASRELLLDQVSYQAEWRDGKAGQHPNDHRNRQSSDALSSLFQHLDAIPPTDILWIRYSRVLGESEDLSGATEQESEMLRAYGFYEAVDVSRDSAVEFLRSLVEACEKLRAAEIEG